MIVGSEIFAAHVVWCTSSPPANAMRKSIPYQNLDLNGNIKNLCKKSSSLKYSKLHNKSAKVKEVLAHLVELKFCNAKHRSSNPSSSIKDKKNKSAAKKFTISNILCLSTYYLTTCVNYYYI